MKPDITYEEFEKLDFRVGKVVEASNPDWSNKLIELHVDFGAEIGERTIFTGIRDKHDPVEMTGKSYIFVANMAARKMGPSQSQGMLIMGDDEPVTLIEVPTAVAPGTVVR